MKASLSVALISYGTIIASLSSAAAFPYPPPPPVITPSICDAAFGNLLQNCGFEAADGVADPWVVVYSPLGGSENIANNDPGWAHSGYGVWGWANGHDKFDAIYQTITTSPGDTYLVSFWLTSTACFDAPTPCAEDNAVVWGFTQSNSAFEQAGSALNIPEPDWPNSHWLSYQYSFVASGDWAQVQFSGYNSPGFDGLDDVVVTDQTHRIPEPATLALFGAGLAGAAAMRRRRAGQRSVIAS